MNDDHPEDSLLIARAFAHPDATSATMIGLDEAGGRWTYTVGGRSESLTVPWSTPISERAERLFVLDASVYLPSYSPEITDDQAEAPGLHSPEDALVLVVANPGENGSTTTNLMAPIVVNSTIGLCTQVILDGQDWPLRAELAHA